MATPDFVRNAFVKMTLSQPFFTELLYQLDMVVDDGIQTLATNARQLFINEAFFKSLKLDLQTSALVHEVLHVALLHGVRRGLRDPKLWNVACDYKVNAILKANKLPLGDGWLYDTKYDGPLEEAIYADLVKRKEEQEKQKGGGKSEPVPDPQWDDVQDNAAGMTPEEVEQYTEEVKQAVAQAVANAKARGDLPGGVEQVVDSQNKAADEPWYNHLHRFMQSLTQGEFNWARINRRMLVTHGVIAPHHYSESLNEVALMIDASGSCFEAAQQANFAEHTSAILAECKPKRVVVRYFDTRVYDGEVIEAAEFDVKLKPRGGGGTRFEPIFEALENSEYGTPDVVIILTDMYGSFPKDAPDYPVLWCDIGDGRAKAPFGETITVKGV